MLESQILILVILIIFSAIFSGMETALMSVNMIKVRTLLKQKKRGSKPLFRLKQNPHKLIITILIGNNLVNIGAASFATIVFTNLFGSAGIGIATGVMTFLILVFGEITPKTLAAQKAVSISLLVARPLEMFSYSISPIVKFFEIFSRFVSKIFGGKKEEKLSEEELCTIVTMGQKEGILTREAAEMMQNVLEFKGTKVTEVMTPKSYIDMVEGKSKIKDILGFLVKTPFSRYPIYSKNKDNIIGLLDVDDVLRYIKNKKTNTQVKKLKKPIYFIPTSKEIDDLLTEFEGKKVQMALVVNEYGKISGLVTIEDILEEIVGDIFSKSQRSSIYIKKINNKLIRVDAKASVEEVNKVLHLGLKKGHFNTIAGFIEHKLHKIPKKGEKIYLKDVTIMVDKVTKKEIKSIKIIKE